MAPTTTPALHAVGRSAATPDPVAERSDDELVEEDLLVEEISIDGMCGVY